MSIRLIAAVASSLLLTPAAYAQYTNQPFFEEADVVRHVRTLDLIEVRLEALGAVTASRDLPPEMAEQAERIVGNDLPRLAGSLRQADPELLAGLEEAAERLSRAAEAGEVEELRETAERMAELVAASRAELLSGGADLEPPLAAAAISRLLLGEPGVAEGYEEAVQGERWEYTLGWAALRRVEEIWSELSPRVEGRSAEVDEALAELRELFSDPLPPASLSGDPEAAEEPAHRITGLLEVLTDTDLYPERDLGRVVAATSNRAASACTAFEAGNARLGIEYALSVRDTYESISGTVGMLASGAHERVESALADLTGTAGEEEEERRAATTDPAAACSALQQGLQEIAGLFGG